MAIEVENLLLPVYGFVGLVPAAVPASIGTDISNALNGRVRGTIPARVTITIPVAPVPPALSLGERVDKALPYPPPVMVDGRPT